MTTNLLTFFFVVSCGLPFHAWRFAFSQRMTSPADQTTGNLNLSFENNVSVTEGTCISFGLPVSLVMPTDVDSGKVSSIRMIDIFHSRVLVRDGGVKPSTAAQTDTVPLVPFPSNRGRRLCNDMTKSGRRAGSDTDPQSQRSCLILHRLECFSHCHLLSDRPLQRFPRLQD
jgi:hypothetical protein